MTKDALFATLDPTSRTFDVQGFPFLLVDTVGFLQELPHSLIEAFHSTLESALSCDLALIVCDASGNFETQLSTTLSTLKELSFDSPYLVVMNKCDIAPSGDFPTGSVRISAKTKEGLPDLKEKIFGMLSSEFISAELFVPYTEMDAYGAVKSLLRETSAEYADDGAHLHVVIPVEYAEKFRRFKK